MRVKFLLLQVVQVARPRLARRDGAMFLQGALEAFLLSINTRARSRTRKQPLRNR